MTREGSTTVLPDDRPVVLARHATGPAVLGAARPGRPDRVRADVQGLRAVAVLLVVLFHVVPGRVPGGYVGVDVFFVISGFLITSHLLRRPPTGGADLAAFWARRVRRLLPASLTVLAATLVASRLVAPDVTWAATAHEAGAAALYVENWSLARSAVDYLAADAAPTPVQHFWSLSVEEQFYLAWPLLVGGAVLLARRRAASGHRYVLAAMLVVLVASFAYGVHVTAADPGPAYFVTPGRAWEFAAGALVALGAARLAALPAALRAAGAWAGLAAIVAAGALYTSRTPFPGWAAAVPVLGTAAVVAAAAQGRWSPQRLWLLPGVRWVGDVSYSVYLWHWPLVVLVPYVSGGTLGLLDKAAVLVATFVLAALSTRLVEDRFRRPGALRTSPRAFAFAAAATAVVLGLAGAQYAEVAWRDHRTQARIAQLSTGPCFGARAAAEPARCPQVWGPPVLPASQAARDMSSAYDDDCFIRAPYDRRETCTYGDGPVRVALVGNSHAGHWLPAVQELARQRGWTVTTYLISACNVLDVPVDIRDPAMRANCVGFSRWAFEQTKGDRYDLVITSERQNKRVVGTDWAGTHAVARRGYERYLSAWAASGARVLVVRDNVTPGPRVGRVPDCLAAHPDDVARCSWPADPRTPANPRAYRWSDPLYDAAGALRDPRVVRMSLEDLLCPAGTCRPVIGGVVTQFDAQHLTRTYVRSLTPYFGARMDAVLGAGWDTRGGRPRVSSVPAP